MRCQLARWRMACGRVIAATSTRNGIQIPPLLCYQQPGKSGPRCIYGTSRCVANTEARFAARERIESEESPGGRGPAGNSHPIYPPCESERRPPKRPARSQGHGRQSPYRAPVGFETYRKIAPPGPAGTRGQSIRRAGQWIVTRARRRYATPGRGLAKRGGGLAAR